MLSQQIKMSAALPYASGSADRSGGWVDMQGFGGLLILVTLGALADAGAVTLKAQHSDRADHADAADMDATGIAVTGTSDDGVRYLDIWQPQRRYVRLVVDKDGTNAAAESALYLQYHARRLPQEHGPGISGELHLSPATGVAY